MKAPLILGTEVGYTPVSVSDNTDIFPAQLPEWYQPSHYQERVPYQLPPGSDHRSLRTSVQVGI